MQDTLEKMTYTTGRSDTQNTKQKGGQTTGAKTTKVSVNLAEQDIKLLAEVSQKTGMSMSDVIRHALGLERLAQEVRDDRNKRLFYDDGKDKYLVVRPGE